MLITDGIHRLTGGVVNFYLIEDDGKLVLVDAGTPGDWDLFAKTVGGSAGRSTTSTPSCSRTHTAITTGFAERARSEAGAIVRIHDADAERAKTGAAPKKESGYGRYLLRPEAYRKLFGLVRRGGVKIVPIHEVSTFGDGETLDVPGRASCTRPVTPRAVARSCSRAGGR